jgi:hypothetical protein
MHMCCRDIAGFNIDFIGSLHRPKSVLACCNVHLSDVPGVELCPTGEETIQSFRRMREMALLECMLPGGERTVTAGCPKCANFQMDDWKIQYLINHVTFGWYPAPCQCRCFYCIDDIQDAHKFMSAEGVAESYERVFGALEYALGEGLIDPNADWEFASGEIAIHPYRNRFLDLVGNRVAFFFTNCFKYDPGVAANLAANPESGILFSVDAGTRETWRKVKGFDNYGAIVENLHRYRGSAQPSQLRLKYIIFPGINDGQADFEGAIALAKSLGRNYMVLAHDRRPSQDPPGALAAAAGRFAATLLQNGMQFTFDPITFTASEVEGAIECARTGRAAVPDGIGRAAAPDGIGCAAAPDGTAAPK